jgi:hypothetical protein
MANATLSKIEREKLLAILRARFEKNMNRHRGLQWADVETALAANPKALRSLYQMESTGGEPDVIGHEQKTGRYVFCDCSPECPKGRCGVCYDREGEQKRIKEGLKPAGNVLDMAAAMGIEPLTEEQYRELQKLGEFDTKTQSWLKTPASIAQLGGAIFGDRRYETVFVYHNTAPCFYRGRGFRGVLKV